MNAKEAKELLEISERFMSSLSEDEKMAAKNAADMRRASGKDTYSDKEIAAAEAYLDSISDILEELDKRAVAAAA